MTQFRHGLALCGLLFAVLPCSAANDELPFNGVVLNALATMPAAFAVRAEPPSATATSYQLGTFTCAVFPDATVYVTDRRMVANGEIWYFVQVLRPGLITSVASACPNGAKGWMIGQLKSGAPVVGIVTPNAAPPTQDIATQTSAALRRPAIPTSGETQPHTFWWYYALLVAGTFVAMILLTWERNRDVRVAPLTARFVVMEVVVLSVTNVLILALVIPIYGSIDTTSNMARLLQKSTQLPEGHFILGFVLTVLLLKSVSFAKGN